MFSRGAWLCCPGDGHTGISFPVPVTQLRLVRPSTSGYTQMWKIRLKVNANEPKEGEGKPQGFQETRWKLRLGGTLPSKLSSMKNRKVGIHRKELNFICASQAVQLWRLDKRQRQDLNQCWQNGKWLHLAAAGLGTREAVTGWKGKKRGRIKNSGLRNTK